ncbi:uncharacterized protein [Macrobrachium rosenbergii]|uniref:uncharacterized protein n=1 Tax=Macrobrachium rosenbergii TaxID=79674 RepID=UPI0034D56BFD
MTKAQERKLEVAEMRTLRRMCGVTRKDRIRNDDIRGTVKVVEVSKKIAEVWSVCHACGREEDHVCRKVMDMEEEEEEEEEEARRRRRRKRKKGGGGGEGQRFGWKDNIANDMREKGLIEQDTQTEDGEG